MRYKIGTYYKYLCIGLFCLLMSAAGLGYAELKVYYVRVGVGEAFWEKTLWRMDADGNNKELVLRPPVPMIAPALSPDGQRLLFTTRPVGAEGPMFKMMVMDFDGGNLRELLAVPPRPVNMVGKWSPDGKWIVYGTLDLAQQPHKFELFVTDAQGLNSFQIAADLEDSILNPFWFPDSRRIGFSIDKRAAKLHWVDADPNAKAKEMDVQLFVQTIYWSPNGKRTIVVRSPEEGARHELFLGDALGKNLIRLTDDAEEPGGVQWLPDSKHIVYRTDTDRPDVAVMNVATKEIQRLTDDGRSQFVFWHDPTLAVEAAGKLSTSWGAIKAQVIDAKK